jgi:hypothetical protein
MKELIQSLQKFAAAADNIVGTERNRGKNGSIYASTSATILELKPLAARHGLSIHIIPGTFSGHLEGAASLPEMVGEQSVHILVTHESGQFLDLGTASMPVNIGNKALSSADKSLIVFKLLTRKVLLGLACIVEVDDEAKTHAAMTAADDEAALLDEAIASLRACTTVETLVETFKTYRAAGLSAENLAILTRTAAEVKNGLLQNPVAQ